MPSVFFSYSHADEDLRNRLEKHLAIMKRSGAISTWHDRRINAGQEFDRQINEHLLTADVILLLVSADFLHSDYCWGVEVARAMERHERGAALVIPVILRPCDWHDAPFGKLLAATPDGKPVTQFPDVDEGFLHVVTALKSAIKSKVHTGHTAPADSPQNRASGGSHLQQPPVPDVRSSNLRVRKTFTDADHDRFADDGFEYMAKFFENSLAELAKRNPKIEGIFKRLDATHFSAKVYENGKERARCRIWVASRRSFAGGIVYSQSDRSDDNSYNESMSVEADEQGMFLKPLGMALRDRGDEVRLTFEGAAEYYWAILMNPLQQ